MSHLGNTEFLEYWFEQGLAQGMTEDEAVDFADSKTQDYI
jgi:hypothetical protein